jgi:hypothetical protein
MVRWNCAKSARPNRVDIEPRLCGNAAVVGTDPTSVEWRLLKIALCAVTLRCGVIYSAQTGTESRDCVMEIDWLCDDQFGIHHHGYVDDQSNAHTLFYSDRFTLKQINSTSLNPHITEWVRSNRYSTNRYEVLQYCSLRYQLWFERCRWICCWQTKRKPQQD